MRQCGYKSSEWYKAAFESCVAAYRILQQIHPDKDLALAADDLELGEIPYFVREID